MKKLSYPLVRFILNSALVLLTAIPCFFLGRWILLSLFDDRPACPLCLYSHVVHDYYAATGISRDTLGALPAEIVEMYGEPDYVDEEYKGEDLYSRRYHYRDFAIMFDSRDPSEVRAEDCGAVGFILYSPDIKIRYDIHVGSTREEIIHAYRKCPSIVYPESNDGEIGDWLHDNGYRNFWDNSLVFTYDENNIVTSITYYP